MDHVICRSEVYLVQLAGFQIQPASPIRQARFRCRNLLHREQIQDFKDTPGNVTITCGSENDRPGFDDDSTQTEKPCSLTSLRMSSGTSGVRHSDAYLFS